MGPKNIKKQLTIEDIIQTCVDSIYKNSDLAKSLVLKGGQALRIVEEVSERFSTDLDFSVNDEIKEFDHFFKNMEQSLIDGFLEIGFHVFDFRYSRRPAVTKKGFPDTWRGWEFNFKIIENEKSSLDLETKQREAYTPIGGLSSLVSIDVSEFEYCESFQKVKIKSGVEVIAYSRPLLVVEKIRALCQKHKVYRFSKGRHLPRARDYYDIERLYSKSLKKHEFEKFVSEARKVLVPCFEKKEVDLALIDRIFDPDFIEVQREDWKSVTSTVKELEGFDYYVEILRQVISEIRS